MADNRMTFTLVGRDQLSRALRQAGASSQRLKKDLMGLGAAAAIPTAGAGAAAALSLAAALGTAGIALGAFGAAIIPQAKEIGNVSKAHDAYRDAVQASGKASSAAADAQLAYSKSVKGLPRATKESAAAFITLKEAYADWSKSLAGDTMPVLTKSFHTFAALLPKLTPLVRGTSKELSRMMTILAGGSAGAGFDKIMKSFTEFSTGVLRRANDGLVHFMRTMRGFDGGPFSDFLAKMRANGPVVADTLTNIARAAGQLLSASSDLGVAVLHVANAFAKLVGAIPSSVLSVILQLYAAFRLASLGAAAFAAVGVVARRVGAQLLTMQIAATGAGGALAGLRAAFLAMSATARATVVVAAIAGLVVVLVKLANIGRAAPPDVDRLTTSLGKLGRTGRVTGEAARAFGKDLGGLADSLRVLARPDISQGTQKWLGELTGIDPVPIGNAKKHLDGIDKSLASLVKSGNAELAASGYKFLAKGIREASKEGGKSALTTKEFRAQLVSYKSALADAKFEQQLAADSMGLFGAQAIKTQQQLDAQKKSADGLRQSIQALNETHRAGLGGMIGFEAAIDAATKAAKENAGALSMSRGQLNLNSEKARTAATALSDLGNKTDEAAAAARDSGASWSKVNGIYDRGRTKLIAAAVQMGLTRAEAKKLAGQILKTPDKTVMLKADAKDLKSKIKDGQAKVDSLKQKRKTAVGADKRQLDREVSKAQAHVDRLKQKRAAALRAVDRTSGGVNSAIANIGRVKGKTISLFVNTYYKSFKSKQSFSLDGPGVRKAQGGLVAFANGGHVQGFPSGGFVSGPGTRTSDSIPARLSNGEFVVRAAAVEKYGSQLFDQLNSMQLPTTGARPANSIRTTSAVGASSSSTSVREGDTYNIYPQRADFSVHDLEALQRRVDTRNRAGRPR